MNRVDDAGETALRILNEHLPSDYRAMPSQVNFAITIYHQDDFPLTGEEHFHMLSEIVLTSAIDPASVVSHAVECLDLKRGTKL